MVLIHSITSALSLVFKRPSLWVPGIILLLVSLFSYEIMTDILASLLFALTNPTALPAIEATLLPAYFYGAYADQINAFLGFQAIMLLLQLFVLYWTANLVGVINKKQALINSFKTTLHNIGQIILFIVFVAVLLIAFIESIFLLIWLGQWLSWIAFIIMAIVLLITAYLVVHFLMVIPIMALNELRLSEALIEAWHFGAKHWLGLLGIIVFLAVFNTVINSLLGLLMPLTENALLQLIISAVLLLFFLTYSNSLYAVYYLEAEKKKVRA